MDDTQAQDQISQLRAELRQVAAAVGDMRAVLLGATGSATARQSELDVRRIVQEGARAFSGGLSTSPYRESSAEEGWWRFGWQLAKDAVKTVKGGW
jgi:hypothetical protein